MSKFIRCAAPNGMWQRYDPVRRRDLVEVQPPMRTAFLSRIRSTSNCESDLVSVPRTIRSRRCNGGWGTSESSCAGAGRTTGGMTAARRPPSGISTCSPGLSSSRRLPSWSSMTSRPVRNRPALKGNGLFPALDSVALLPPRIIGIAHDFACAFVEQKRLNGAQERSLSRRLKRVFSPAEARRFAGLQGSKSRDRAASSFRLNSSSVVAFGLTFLAWPGDLRRCFGNRVCNPREDLADGVGV